MINLPGVTWFVGCGNMAGAMVEGWRIAGLDLSQAVAVRPSGTPVEGVRTVSSLAEAGGEPKLVVLGFKPQQLDEIAVELAPLLTNETVVVSILAGSRSTACGCVSPMPGRSSAHSPIYPWPSGAGWLRSTPTISTMSFASSSPICLGFWAMPPG